MVLGFILLFFYDWSVMVSEPDVSNTDVAKLTSKKLPPNIFTPILTLQIIFSTPTITLQMNFIFLKNKYI